MGSSLLYIRLYLCIGGNIIFVASEWIFVLRFRWGYFDSISKIHIVFVGERESVTVIFSVNSCQSQSPVPLFFVFFGFFRLLYSQMCFRCFVSKTGNILEERQV